MLKALKAGKPVRVVGTMSGTSLDGVDAAVLVTNGVSAGEAGETAFRPYSRAEQAVLRAALGQWSGPQVEAATEVVETAHAEVLSRFEEVDLIGFHGQTLAHNPGAGRTLQVGDGAILAEVLGVPVVSDFRSNDVKMGGQGAPLAPFYHHALARAGAFGRPVAVLNLGGVGNLTWVNPSVGLPEAEGALSAFDTGPANAPINDAMRQRRGLEYDKAGALAVQGAVDDAVLARFLGHRYFAKIPPKSLDRDDFASLLGEVAALSDVDAIATLTACAAAGVMHAMEHCPQPPAQVLVTGGGRHNTTLMEMISVAVSCPVVPVEDVGWDGDMLEAQAFAFLAARVIRGLPTSCPASTGVGAAVGGGAVSIPEGLV